MRMRITTHSRCFVASLHRRERRAYHLLPDSRRESGPRQDTHRALLLSARHTVQTRCNRQARTWTPPTATPRLCSLRASSTDGHGFGISHTFARREERRRCVCVCARSMCSIHPRRCPWSPQPRPRRPRAGSHTLILPAHSCPHMKAAAAPDPPTVSACTLSSTAFSRRPSS